jgi:hypothetical protein
MRAERVDTNNDNTFDKIRITPVTFNINGKLEGGIVEIRTLNPQHQQLTYRNYDEGHLWTTRVEQINGADLSKQSGIVSTGKISIADLKANADIIPTRCGWLVNADGNYITREGIITGPGLNLPVTREMVNNSNIKVSTEEIEIKKIAPQTEAPSISQMPMPEGNCANGQCSASRAYTIDRKIEGAMFGTPTWAEYKITGKGEQPTGAKAQTTSTEKIQVTRIDGVVTIDAATIANQDKTAAWPSRLIREAGFAGGVVEPLTRKIDQNTLVESSTGTPKLTHVTGEFRTELTGSGVSALSERYFIYKQGEFNDSYVRGINGGELRQTITIDKGMSQQELLQTMQTRIEKGFPDLAKITAADGSDKTPISNSKGFLRKQKRPHCVSGNYV